jgi:hypothetical protein
VYITHNYTNNIRNSGRTIVGIAATVNTVYNTAVPTYTNYYNNYSGVILPSNNNNNNKAGCRILD